MQWKVIKELEASQTNNTSDSFQKFQQDVLDKKLIFQHR